MMKYGGGRNETGKHFSKVALYILGQGLALGLWLFGTCK